MSSPDFSMRMATRAAAQLALRSMGKAGCWWRTMSAIAYGESAPRLDPDPSRLKPTFRADQVSLQEKRISVASEVFLKDVLAEIGVLGERADALLHIRGVDVDRCAGAVARREADLLQQPLHYRMQAPGADILDRAVDIGGKRGECIDCVLAESERHLLGLHQGLVLLDEACFRLDQDTAEVVARERVQLDADRQAALQLGQEVRRLGHVKGARCNEQDVIGLHRAVLGG